MIVTKIYSNQNHKSAFARTQDLRKKLKLSLYKPFLCVILRTSLCKLINESLMFIQETSTAYVSGSQLLILEARTTFIGTPLVNSLARTLTGHQMNQITITIMSIVQFSLMVVLGMMCLAHCLIDIFVKRILSRFIFQFFNVQHKHYFHFLRKINF